MSSSPDWEKLFNKRAYCSVCGEDVTIQSCDCLEYDVLDGEDTFDDIDE